MKKVSFTAHGVKTMATGVRAKGFDFHIFRRYVVLYLKNPGFFDDIFAFFVLLRFFKCYFIFPTEHRLACCAVDVTNSVQASHKDTVFARTQRHVNPVKNDKEI